MLMVNASDGQITNQITSTNHKSFAKKWFKSKPQIKNQITNKSNPNQLTRFPNQIIILQIKSLCVIQSWFKSNHDLDLPITGKRIVKTQHKTPYAISDVSSSPCLSILLAKPRVVTWRFVLLQVDRNIMFVYSHLCTKKHRLIQLYLCTNVIVA